MIFLKVSESIDLLDIEKIEKDFDVYFSDDFKTHYLKYNGGYPEKDKFIWNDNSTTTINTFFSIKYIGFGNFESTYKDLVIKKEYLPKGIFPFATDDGGNFFCISFRSVDFNNIYYCNNDNYDEKNNEKHLIFINSSFNNFLSGLR